MAQKKIIEMLPIHAVGWARHSRHHSEDRQVRALETAGCRRVYRASEAHMADLVRSLRPEAPEAVRVTTLARLASTRDMLREAINAIHERGCWIEETTTGRTTKGGHLAAGMALDAATELTADARAPTRRQARKMALLSHERQRENGAARRMPIPEARKIWHEHDSWSNDDCLALMPGWTEGTAYRHLGTRQLAKGRPRLRKLKGR